MKRAIEEHRIKQGAKNPSYPKNTVAPHCTLMPRECYCNPDGKNGEIRKCHIANNKPAAACEQLVKIISTPSEKDRCLGDILSKAQSVNSMVGILSNRLGDIQ